MNKPDISKDPQYKELRQRYADSLAMGDQVRKFLITVDEETRKRYNEWQLYVNTHPAKAEPKPDLDKLEGWGYTKGTYTYQNLRDRLTAVGERTWDLPTSREELEKLVHTHTHTGTSMPSNCPGCTWERDRP